MPTLAKAMAEAGPILGIVVIAVMAATYRAGKKRPDSAVSPWEEKAPLPVWSDRRFGFGRRAAAVTFGCVAHPGPKTASQVLECAYQILAKSLNTTGLATATAAAVRQGTGTAGALGNWGPADAKGVVLACDRNIRLLPCVGPLVGPMVNGCRQSRRGQGGIVAKMWRNLTNV